jgi:predicted ester cyclase
MNEERNKATVRAVFAALDDAQSMNPLEEVVAVDYLGYFPGTPPLDITGMKALGNSFYAACPGLAHSLDELVAEGDTVAARLTIRGTHTQPFQTPAGAIPPQGRPFTIDAMNFYRFRDGTLVEHRASFDMMSFLQQIGAIPAPEASAA